MEPEAALAAVYEQWLNEDYGGVPFLYFTAVVKTPEGGRPKYGPRFAAYIRRHKLGEVVSPKAQINPNSNNKVKVYAWAVSATRFHAWAAKQDWFEDWANRYRLPR